MKILYLLFSLLPIIGFGQTGRQVINFNANWQFRNQEDIVDSTILPNAVEYFFSGWESVNLPHTAKIEPLIIVDPWVGISWYKKDFIANPDWKNKKVSVEFEAVMQQTEVWLNGKHLMTHFGGYLPFSVDVSSALNYGKTNRLIVKTNNTDSAEIPPGKQIKKLDFCYYSGIYRNVSLLITNLLHVSDDVTANIVASGGIRVWCPEVSKKVAKITVSTHIINESANQKSFTLVYKLINEAGKLVFTNTSEKQGLNCNNSKSVIHVLSITNPTLWHPNHPHLYTLQVTLYDGKSVADEYRTRIGIRKFAIINNNFLINGEPFLLVGTNRHQEYPYIGNSLSDNAQYRDAMKIKKAGFNTVRLSHYPQSNAFMNACDELGILTIAAIPGWQFVGNEAFMKHSLQDARELIRRDRNHASVAMWELSLNETTMSDEFMRQMVAIAQEESPESKLITCGWINKYYDVWIPARQHAKAPDYWKKYKGKTPLFTGEYGDWEYFAHDAGLNQAGYAGLKRDERTSRQLRGDGEKRLLQQAANFQEAHNDNLQNPHLGDANWLMFDYNRGYSPDIESSGLMDLFRLPKFTYYFYKTQIKPTKSFDTLNNTAVVKIASFWNQETDFENLKIFSNCDEVALYLNNILIERKRPIKSDVSCYLNYPPLIFMLKGFISGELKAIGYIQNKVVAQDIVSTAGKPEKIKLTYDRSGKSLKADGADVVFVYATITDKNGNIVATDNSTIRFELKGGGRLIGQNPINAEAGIASILLQAGNKPENLIVEAKGDGLYSSSLKISSEFR